MARRFGGSFAYTTLVGIEVIRRVNHGINRID